jgi:DNA-binding transcriptional regulator of glucitol operon
VITCSSDGAGDNQAWSGVTRDRDTVGRYRSAYSDEVRRLVLSPRWIMWHLLTVGAMVTCGLLAAWQWHRAGSAMGSALNVGYGLQWPLFAVFFGYMWWRMIHLEVRRIRGELPEHPWDAQERPGPAPVVAAPAAEARAAVSAGPSPFGPRPVRTGTVRDEDDPEMASYNRMLAALAARDDD